MSIGYNSFDLLKQKQRILEVFCELIVAATTLAVFADFFPQNFFEKFRIVFAFFRLINFREKMRKSLRHTNENVRIFC